MVVLLIIHSPYKRVKWNLICVTNFSFLFQSVPTAATIQVVCILKKTKNKPLSLTMLYFSFLKVTRKSLLFTFMRNGDLYWLEWGVPSLQSGRETNVSFACKNPQRSCIWGFSSGSPTHVWKCNLGLISLETLTIKCSLWSDCWTWKVVLLWTRSLCAQTQREKQWPGVPINRKSQNGRKNRDVVRCLTCLTSGKPVPQ